MIGTLLFWLLGILQAPPAPKQAVVETSAGTFIIDLAPEQAPVTAALSSLANVFLWNLLLARLVDLARDAGVPLPLWRSSNVEGGDAANAALLAQYQKRVPSL